LASGEFSGVVCVGVFKEGGARARGPRGTPEKPGGEGGRTSTAASLLDRTATRSGVDPAGDAAHGIQGAFGGAHIPEGERQCLGVRRGVRFEKCGFKHSVDHRNKSDGGDDFRRMDFASPRGGGGGGGGTFGDAFGGVPGAHLHVGLCLGTRRHTYIDGNDADMKTSCRHRLEPHSHPGKTRGCSRFFEMRMYNVSCCRRHMVREGHRKDETPPRKGGRGKGPSKKNL